MTEEKSPLILASSSPRRQELLQRGGYRFEVQPPPLDEPAHLGEGLSPRAFAEALAYYKARSVADRVDGVRVLGADTVVSLGDRVLGKPRDEADARGMLRDLSHQRHAVITGVALVEGSHKRFLTADITWVTMQPMSPGDIDEYIATGEWEGKAGAYAIQETADRYVQSLEGSFSNVVGLPMELLERLLGAAPGSESNP